MNVYEKHGILDALEEADDLLNALEGMMDMVEDFAEDEASDGRWNYMEQTARIVKLLADKLRGLSGDIREMALAIVPAEEATE